MSRIGNNPINIPEGVSVNIEGNIITVNGKNGEMSQSFDGVSFDINNETIIRKALAEGHRPSTTDKFQPLRIENETLRCLYFGEDSPHCVRIYTK